MVVLNALLLSVWLVLSSTPAFAFAESFTCHVTGFIYTALDETPDFTRSDHCLQVKDQIHQDGLLVLYSTNWFVLIQVPEEIGHQRFWYRWGATKAHIEGKTLRVRSHRILSA